MPDIQRIHKIVSQFVDHGHKSVVRSWTSFLNKPLFIKGSSVRALSIAQLTSEFQRDVGYLQIDLSGDITAPLFWFFDFRQLLSLSALVLLNDNPDLSRRPKDLSFDEIESLQAMAHNGALALVRGQAHLLGMTLELQKSSVHFVEEERLGELEKMIPESLYRVVHSHLEVFGQQSSAMITLMSDSFTKQLFELLKDQKNIKTSYQTTILIVDSHSSSCALLCQMFQSLEVEILEAGKGKEAMEMVDKHSVDLVFYDVHMKDMDGEHFARWLRRRPLDKKLPLIFCATEVSSEMLIKSKQAGMDDFLLKPPSEVKVKNIVNKYLPEIVM